MVAASEKTISVLIVDDCPATRALLRRLLEKRSIHVEEATDGHEAIAKMSKTSPFDLVLVDWDMPTMSGLEMLKEVKKDLSLSKTRMMMVSGLSTTSHIEEALEAGAVDYLMKPFDTASLMEKLSWLGINA